MPYDPNVPATNAEATSAMFRNQFQGLKELIDTFLGGGISSVVVDGVNTVPAGTPANVSLNLTGTVLHFSFDLPQGNEGQQGPVGGEGGTGPQGPPFANAVVDAVNTVPPGSPANVGVIFDGTNVRFTFSIPQGADGATGATGQPGEVSQTELDNAMLNTLGQTSNNSNGVGTLDNPFADPDTEELRNKVNELILALRR